MYNQNCKELKDSPVKGKITPEDEEKMRRVLPFEEAAEYLQHNPYIRHGYRGYLTTKLCVERFVHNFVNISIVLRITHILFKDV